jgi:hypothetical protein
MSKVVWWTSTAHLMPGDTTSRSTLNRFVSSWLVRKVIPVMLPGFHWIAAKRGDDRDGDRSGRGDRSNGCAARRDDHRHPSVD